MKHEGFSNFQSCITVTLTLNLTSLPVLDLSWSKDVSLIPYHGPRMSPYHVSKVMQL